MRARQDSLVINLEIFFFFLLDVYVGIISLFVIYYMFWNNYYFIVGYLILFIFRRSYEKMHFAYLVTKCLVLLNEQCLRNI